MLWYNPLLLWLISQLVKKQSHHLGKRPFVTPIFKFGSKTQVTNYRPISILPIVSKVAEKWIANQLIKHLDKGFNPLHRMQFCFRPNHSTETANCFSVEKIVFTGYESVCRSRIFRSSTSDQAHTF